MKLIKTFFRKYFLSGVLILLPIVFTIWIFAYLVRTLDNLTRPLMKILFPEFFKDLIPFEIHGYGIILTLAIILIVGAIGKNYIGQYFINLSEKVLEKLPLIPKVYSSIKQVLRTFVSDEKSNYSGVALLEYPRKGLYTIAFITGTPEKNLLASAAEEEMVNLYVPTTPNPTSGYYVVAKESEIKRLDIPIEKALKLILSCGIMHESDGITRTKT